MKLKLYFLWIHLAVSNQWAMLPGGYETRSLCDREIAEMFVDFPEQNIGYWCFPEGLDPNKRGL